MVKLTYAKGWRLPRGSRIHGGLSQEIALRESGEEISMVSHGAVRALALFDYNVDHRHTNDFVFLFKDASYLVPRWSLEIEDDGKFWPHDLPADTARVTRKTLKYWKLKWSRRCTDLIEL
ncbi:MAG TPA: hypothetical protein VGB48_02120 [Allosphingosinicella sp.]